MLSRSRTDRARRSRRVTTTMSPGCTSFNIRCRAARSPFAPLFFSLWIRLQPASFRGRQLAAQVLLGCADPGVSDLHLWLHFCTDLCSTVSAHDLVKRANLYIYARGAMPPPLVGTPQRGLDLEPPAARPNNYRCSVCQDEPSTMWALAAVLDGLIIALVMSVVGLWIITRLRLWRFRSRRRGNAKSEVVMTTCWPEQHAA